MLAAKWKSIAIPSYKAYEIAGKISQGSSSESYILGVTHGHLVGFKAYCCKTIQLPVTGEVMDSKGEHVLPFS